MIDSAFDEIIKYFVSETARLYPSDYRSSEKNLLIKAVEYYSRKAATFISSNKELDDNSKRIYVQLVGEWTFHKTIDFVNTKLPIKFFKKVLNAIFEAISLVTLKKFKEKAPIEDILESVEFIVIDTWTAEILNLKKQGLISNEKCLDTLKNSNFDKMENPHNPTDDLSDIYEKDEKKKENEKYNDKIEKSDVICTLLGLFSIPLILAFIIGACYFIYSISNKLFLFSLNCEHFIYYSITLIGAIWFLNRLIEKKKLNKMIDELEQVKQNFKDTVNPINFYNKLFKDEITIALSENIAMQIDTDMLFENRKYLLPSLPALRQRVTDELGYIIPNIKIIENVKLKNYEFEIYIKQNIVLKKEINSSKAKEIYSDFIIKELKKVLIEHVDFIISRNYIKVLLENGIQKGTKPEYKFKVSEFEEKGISLEFVREIVVNLLREKFSVKNVVFIFEKIVKYYDFYKIPDEISEKIRQDFSIKISNDISDKNDCINCFTISQNYQKFLQDKIKYIENSKKLILSEKEEKNLIDEISYLLKSTEKQNIVFVCNSEIRLALFRLVSQYLSEIVIVSDKEISQNKNLIVLNSMKGDFNA